MANFWCQGAVIRRGKESYPTQQTNIQRLKKWKRDGKIKGSQNLMPWFGMFFGVKIPLKLALGELMKEEMLRFCANLKKKK